MEDIVIVCADDAGTALKESTSFTTIINIINNNKCYLGGNHTGGGGCFSSTKIYPAISIVNFDALSEAAAKAPAKTPAQAAAAPTERQRVYAFVDRSDISVTQDPAAQQAPVAQQEKIHVYEFKDLTYELTAEDKKITAVQFEKFEDLKLSNIVPKDGSLFGQFYMDGSFYVLVKEGTTKVTATTMAPQLVPFQNFVLDGQRITSETLKDKFIIAYGKKYDVYTITKETTGSNLTVKITPEGLQLKLDGELQQVQIIGASAKKYVTVLGARRLVRKQGRTSYINYKGSLIKLSDAKKMEKKKP